MTADFFAKRASAPFSIRTDAQPSRNGAFAKTGRKADFAQGFWGGKPLNKQTVATRSLLAKLIITRHRNINHLQRNHLFVLIAKLVVVFQNHINEFSAIDASYNRNTVQILLRILRVV